jgi:hypothetical protein
MKKALLIALAAFTSCFCFSQTTQYTRNNFICSYYGEPINTPVTGFASSADAKNVIAHIIDVVGLEPTFEIRAANIPNAAAVISSGKRYILYNPDFIAAINQAAKNKWASIAILAHEIGHHLNGHTLLGAGSHPETELEADQFSGFILRKMGATLEQAELSMQLVANDQASSTHPGRPARLISIENGWNKADAQITGKQYIAKTITPQIMQPQIRMAATQPVNNTRYALNPKYIRFDVFFFADRDNPYYVTTGDNLVTIRGSEITVLGKIVASGNAQFPLAIQMNGKNEFYISESGVIVTNTRKQVGYLKTYQKV